MPTETSLVIYPPADPQWGHLRGIVCPKESEDEETQDLLDENSAITPELRDALGMDRSTISYRFIPMEGQRLFYSLQPKDDSYESTLEVLSAFFTPKVNVCVERYRFRKRRQTVEESVDRYVADFRELASTCAFGPLEDELLRDQLIEGTSSPAIREKLLSVPDLTLDQAITIAKQMETAKKKASCLLTATADTPVNALNKRQQAPALEKRSASSKLGQRPLLLKQCFRCGSTRHLANATECRARKVQCNNCQKLGHFAKIETSKQLQHARSKRSSSVQMLEVGQLNTIDGIYVTLQVACSNTYRPLRCMVDTGSPVSIIPRALWQKTFASVSLRPPSVLLTSYCKGLVPVLGCFDADVKFKGKSAHTTFDVAQYGKPLIGMDLISALNIAIHGSKLVSNIAEVTTEVRAHAKLRNYVHKVKLKANYNPIRQKLRRLPRSVREAVSKEVTKLLNQGIVESVEASEWVSPIVVVHKKDGSIRLCVDLREANKAIVPDMFPLPHIEDLLLRFNGATVFSV
ncbi:hypothetical protein M513_11925 [Trichuris suis]|uniref:CCHC-type domain-containing protein n=1 Tax=Trichuris suis TaxID=68888 RepID=A0A085LQH2_9BILA|nr:hypothetical protein M513_11925 [Trichuris suis]